MSIRPQHLSSPRGNLAAVEVLRTANFASRSAAPAMNDAQRAVEGAGPRPDVAPPDPPHRARRRFVLAALLAAVWMVALILLAAFTANPVTLNRDQVRRSDWVVTGTVVDLDKSLVAVEKEWKRGRITGEIAVRNLRETSARTGERYILPLSADKNGGTRYRVTESPVPRSAPPVYPATEEALAQLHAILEP